jgi:hypothetical protein
MRITIEIDDGDQQPRVEVTGTAAAGVAGVASEAAIAAPLDAGPAPDIFTGRAEPPPGVTDLSSGPIVSDGAVVDAGAAPPELP